MSPPGAVDDVEALLKRGQTLLHELQVFHDHLTEKNLLNRVHGTTRFQRTISKEIQHTAKLLEANISDEQRRHSLRSSNLTYLEAVWSAAKRSRGIRDFPLGLSTAKGNLGSPDIVAENGSLWIKVSTISEHRVLMELANDGWRGSDEDTDEDAESEAEALESHSDSAHPSDDEDGITILKAARRVLKASRTVRINYRHPQLQFILPNITEGRVPQIDTILESVRSTGFKILFGIDLGNSPSIKESLARMAFDDYNQFTNTLNIDCTVLLAIVSDISHGDVGEQQTSRPMIRDQMKMEAKHPLLPQLLPMMRERRLQCTEAAASHMRQIVNEIGTASEQERTAIMFGHTLSESNSGDLLQDLQRLSSHAIPSDLHLPIEIVSDKAAADDLPPIAHKVAESLRSINRSVFLYGWATGYTTITSNKGVANLIKRLVEEYRTSEDEVGPNIWLSTYSRSLLAKEPGEAWRVRHSP
ncbi:hypothetical protein NA57DRAFT_51602 [Rhizodiscina lignyota]|uniref:DUF1308 domain-containing protein n=1 Tax=Rhizodiscina lignyota TaxID=1504668 RepID=A0A9P4MBM1_9PEZI|nr:hypothetical protein NA57DRAFT_51602 [Rhizodiscina lignyota]